MAADGGWAPLLEGDLAERAAEAVEAIALDLQETARARTGLLPEPRQSSLANGWPGLALFFAYFHKARPEKGYDDLAIDLLERAMEGIQAAEPSPSLYSGFPGVGWVLEHLQGALFDVQEGEDPGESAITAVNGYLAEPLWPWGPGLLGGLTGLGVYALERLPRSGGIACLERITVQLAESAELLPEGAAWRTPPEDSLAEARKRFPGGHYNVGLALGAPGIVALLAGACAIGLDSRPLLESAVTWIFSQRLPPSEPSLFPFTVAPEGCYSGRQLSWCYGDLGIATALFLAARAVDEPSWELEALQIARASAVRPIRSLRAAEGNLCHGTAGAGHLFNRLFQATGDPLFKAAALAWFERTLEIRRPGQGIGGFPALRALQETGKMLWEADPGFKEGAAGVGLALLAALTPVEPEWDRLILASLRGIPTCEGRLIQDVNR